MKSSFFLQKYPLNVIQLHVICEHQTNLQYTLHNADANLQPYYNNTILENNT